MKEIFNIFLPKRKETEKRIKEKPRIIADFREKNSLIISEIISLGIDIEFKTLKVADYIVGGVAIERKTVSDFISSMLNRRLLFQLEEMQQYDDKLLMIEGIDEHELYVNGLPENQTGLHPNSVRGFLLSILLNHKVPIIFTKDSEDSARFISVLAKRGKKEMPLNVKKKSLNKRERMQYILEGFPGIGPKTARKLLKEFKTIKGTINSDFDNLKKILGKKAETVKKIIEQEY